MMHHYTINLKQQYARMALWLAVLLTALLGQTLQAQCTESSISNMVRNGDFAQGNKGFDSGYDSCKTANCLYAEGFYSVGKVAAFYHSNFAGRDHTTSTDNFMIVNGSGSLNAIVWSQEITVKPGVLYNFSSWVSSVNVQSPAKLQFQINGVTIGNIFTAPNNLNNWVRFDEEWNSGSATKATITILNQNNDLGGNDFGLDDISFIEVCPTQQPLLGDDISICGLGTLNLLSNIVATPTTTITWSTGATGTGVAAPTTINIADPGTYWVCIKDGSCIKSDSLIVTAGFTVDLGPDLIICTQSSFILDSDRENNYTTYKWYKNNILMDSARRSLVVTSPGTYRVEVYDASCNVTESDEVVVTSQSAIPTDVNFCPPQVPTFKVTPNPTGGFKWYDHPNLGTAVGKGSSMQFNAVSTKTLYAEDTTAFYYTVGAKSQFPSGINNSNTPSEDFIFDAKESFTLKSVTVYAYVYSVDAPLSIKVTLKDAADGTIVTKTVSLKGPPIIPYQNIWPFTVPLNIAVPVGTDLKLSSVGSASQFFFAQDGVKDNSVGWPSYQVPDIITLKGLEVEKTWPRAQCDCYGIFYNWEIEKGTKCARTPVTAHYYCPLPLQWLGLSATRNSDASVSIAWQTAHAESGHVFVVERSTDGTNFEKIYLIETQAFKNDYTYRDEATEPSRRYYYRISETDASGNVLSNSSLVSVTGTEAQYTVHPNPSTGVLHLATTQGLIEKVEIYSKLGVLLYSERPVADAQLTLNVSTVKAGVYVLKIYTSDDVYVQTFVKN